MNDQIDHVVNQSSVLVVVLLARHRLGDDEVQVSIFRMPENDPVGIFVFAEHDLQFEDRIGQARQRKVNIFENRCFTAPSHRGNCRIHPLAEFPQVRLLFFVLCEGDCAQGFHVRRTLGAECLELRSQSVLVGRLKLEQQSHQLLMLA